MPSTERLPSGKYRGVYRDSARNKQHTPATDLKQDAYDAAIEAEAKAKRHAAVKAGTLSARTTWGQWWEIVHEDRHFESDAGLTEDSLVRAYVMPRWGDEPLNRIAQRDIQKWVDRLSAGTAPVDMVSERFVRKPLSASYVQRIYSPFRVSITKALDEGVLDASPCQGVKVPKRVKKPKQYLSTSDAAKLAPALGHQVYRDAVEFMFETGLRPGELTGLHSHRIDRESRNLTVAETYVFRAKKIRGWPKDGDTRVIPLSTKALEIVQRRLDGRAAGPCGVEHMRGEKCANPLVFMSVRGRPLSRETLNLHLTQAAKDAKVPHKTGYAVRRGYATRLAEGGLDAFELARVMGHEDINLSREYVQQAASAQARVLAALGERPQLAAVENVGQDQARGTGRGTDSDSQTPSAARKKSRRKRA